LPGDVDQNGVVTGLDGGAVRQHFLQFPTSTGYTPLDDTYGKGAITGLDLLTVQGTLLTQLPATDPGQSSGGGQSGSDSPPGATTTTKDSPAVVATPTVAVEASSVATAPTTTSTS